MSTSNEKIGSNKSIVSAANKSYPMTKNASFFRELLSKKKKHQPSHPPPLQARRSISEPTAHLNQMTKHATESAMSTISTTRKAATSPHRTGTTSLIQSESNHSSSIEDSSALTTSTNLTSIPANKNKQKSKYKSKIKKLFS